MLVVAPTRELAQQIKEVAKDFCSVAGVYEACLFGGGNKHLQVIILNIGFILLKEFFC